MTAQTVISATYPPHIDVTKTPLAFGDRAVPRLVRDSLISNILLPTILANIRLLVIKMFSYKELFGPSLLTSSLRYALNPRCENENSLSEMHSPKHQGTAFSNYFQVLPAPAFASSM